MQPLLPWRSLAGALLLAIGALAPPGAFPALGQGVKAAAAFAEDMGGAAGLAAKAGANVTAVTADVLGSAIRGTSVAIGELWIEALCQLRAVVETVPVRIAARLTVPRYRTGTARNEESRDGA